MLPDGFPPLESIKRHLIRCLHCFDENFPALIRPEDIKKNRRSRKWQGVGESESESEDELTGKDLKSWNA